MTVGRVAANYPRLGDKRDEFEGKVEEAYVFIGLVFPPIYMQCMSVGYLFALHEQVRAQCDTILGAQREVFVN